MKRFISVVTVFLVLLQGASVAFAQFMIAPGFGGSTMTSEQQEQMMKMYQQYQGGQMPSYGGVPSQKKKKKQKEPPPVEESSEQKSEQKPQEDSKFMEWLKQQSEEAPSDVEVETKAKEPQKKKEAIKKTEMKTSGKKDKMDKKDVKAERKPKAKKPKKTARAIEGGGKAARQGTEAEAGSGTASDLQKQAEKRLSSPFHQPFVLGPGADREQFLVVSKGTGTLGISVEWTGTASSLKLEITPRTIASKVSTNSGESAGADNTGNLGTLVKVREGASPIEESISISSTNKNWVVTVMSTQGSAAGTIVFSETGKIKTVTKKELLPSSLPPVAKVLAPVIMYELDRSFQSLSQSQKNALDTNIEQTVTGKSEPTRQKLQNAVNKYKALPDQAKAQLFSPEVLQILTEANGNALTGSQLQQISGLVKGVLPPTAPKNLTASVKLTDIDVMETGGAAGKKLKLNWDHNDNYETGFVIERAPLSLPSLTPSFTVNPGSMSFSEFKTTEASPTNNFGIDEVVAGDPDNFCYRVKAINANGSSGHSNVVCPKVSNVSFQYTKYNLKWTKLKADKESDVDGLSNSDEPYIIFTMINGVDADGKPMVWTRRWTGADDVDTGETEPDGGSPWASFTLLGKPPTDAMTQLENLKTQRAGLNPSNPSEQAQYDQLTDQINNHPWGSINFINVPDRSEHIDLTTGLTVNMTVMEHDAGDTISLEEQIRAGIDMALDIMEAAAAPDPYHIAIAVKSTLEFLYSLWANDDLVGNMTYSTDYWTAWKEATPGMEAAKPKVFNANKTGTGKYKVFLCLYPEGTSDQAVTSACRQ